MTENNGGAEIPSPTLFSHSVKIEQTAKGARITVHVNANGSDAAQSEAIVLYLKTKSALAKYEDLAPFEVRP